MERPVNSPSLGGRRDLPRRPRVRNAVMAKTKGAVFRHQRAENGSIRHGGGFLQGTPPHSPSRGRVERSNSSRTSLGGGGVSRLTTTIAITPSTKAGSDSVEVIRPARNVFPQDHRGGAGDDPGVGPVHIHPLPVKGEENQGTEGGAQSRPGVGVSSGRSAPGRRRGRWRSPRRAARRCAPPRSIPFPKRFCGTGACRSPPPGRWT